MALSVLNIGSEANIYFGNVSFESMASAVDLLALPAVSGDSNFNAESKWSKILVKYEHANGQNIFLTHVKEGTAWKASGVFLEESNLGTWEKKSVVLIDFMNDKLVIDRTTIGAGEDVTVASYQP